MKYNPDIHKRRSIRLKNYDYSQSNSYFVTTCIQGRECLLGEICESQVKLSHYGVTVEQVWQSLPEHFSGVSLDFSIIMPNHFHGIILILDMKNTEKKPTLGQIMAYFKYQSTKLVNKDRDMIGVKLWQRSYYEHIIRSESSLLRLRNYISENPKTWEIDQLHPSNSSHW